MKLYLCIFLLINISVVSASSDAFEEEALYNQYRTVLSKTYSKSLDQLPFTNREQKLFVDALEDGLYEGTTSHSKLAGEVPSFNFSIIEKLRIEILKIKFNSNVSFDSTIAEETISELKQPIENIRLIYVIAAHEDLLLKAGQNEIVNLAKMSPAYLDVAENNESEDETLADVVTDLYFNTPDTSKYMGGEYAKSVKIFMFCRVNRLYPCLMVMKDTKGMEVREGNLTLWSHPVLASSKFGIPSYQRNGNTPAGIFTIDSVMPTADQQVSYGKFRRMMLNFIPKSKDEVLIKSLIPKSSWDHDWWSSTTVARDIGRNMFRIHGTGKINEDANTPYYPFVRTSGCIANKENTYDGITYANQRVLLDKIMSAMGLVPTYENEPKIKGMLYIIELSDKSEPVTLNELSEFGIK